MTKSFVKEQYTFVMRVVPVQPCPTLLLHTTLSQHFLVMWPFSSTAQWPHYLEDILRILHILWCQVLRDATVITLHIG